MSILEDARTASILLVVLLAAVLHGATAKAETDPVCDEGVSYDPFGNMTNGLPGVFAIADTPANVRATPNGTLLFTLEGQAAMTIQPHGADWYVIQIRVYVSPTQPFPPESGQLAANTQLMDCYGTPVGHIASLTKGKYSGVQVHTRHRRIVLEGLTHRQNLRDINWDTIN